MATRMSREEFLDEDEPAPRRRRPRRRGLAIAICLCLVFAGAAGWFGWQYYHAQSRLTAATAQTADTILKRVGALINLPAGETPTIATVEDRSKLVDQAFFSQAQNGDKLLIYTKAKKAIIFRPSNNKIINVGPIAVDATAR